MLETKVVKIVKNTCLELNCLPYFVQPVAGSGGVPDSIIKLPLGGTIHLELKGDSKLRKAQRIFIEKSDNAWEARYNKKAKRVEVHVDQDNLDEVVELGLFLAMCIQDEIDQKGYRDYYLKTELEKKERRIYLDKLGIEEETLADYEELL